MEVALALVLVLVLVLVLLFVRYHAPPMTYTPSALEPTFEYPRHTALWRQVAPTFATDDLSHDRSHLLRVYRWALALSAEAGADRDLAGAAALVHDLVNLPKNHPDRALAAVKSALAAPEVLAAAGYREDEVAAIAEAVRTSSWSSGLDATGPLGRLLQDADRLDAIGAIGIARSFACAQRMVDRGSALELYHAGDPIGRAGRAADDRCYAVDHFAVKLLRLAETMNLPAARAEALRRHAVMTGFLDALDRELTGPAPEPISAA